MTRPSLAVRIAQCARVAAVIAACATAVFAMSAQPHSSAAWAADGDTQSTCCHPPIRSNDTSWGG